MLNQGWVCLKSEDSWRYVEKTAPAKTAMESKIWWTLWFEDDVIMGLQYMWVFSWQSGRYTGITTGLSLRPKVSLYFLEETYTPSASCGGFIQQYSTFQPKATVGQGSCKTKERWVHTVDWLIRKDMTRPWKTKGAKYSHILSSSVNTRSWDLYVLYTYIHQNI